MLTFAARLLSTSRQPDYLSTQIALAGGEVPDWTEESISVVGLGFSVVIPRTWAPDPGSHPDPVEQLRFVACGSRSLRRQTQLPSARYRVAFQDGHLVSSGRLVRYHSLVFLLVA